ncbi:MAG: hypothetical protein IPK17_11305 [Chloroflexi bacterium]|nr:hypothetical protein [Chloroflexota bacterium]
MTSAAYSPNGRWILSASDDKSLKVWDIEHGVCYATFYADVTSVAASGHRIASELSQEVI